MKTYFIKNTGTGHIKIGKAAMPSERLRQLQTGSPHRLEIIGVIDGDMELELHAKYEGQRCSGEWFEPSDQLLFEAAGNGNTDSDDLAVTVSAVRIGGKKLSKAVIAQIPTILNPAMVRWAIDNRMPFFEYLKTIQVIGYLTGASSVTSNSFGKTVLVREQNGSLAKTNKGEFCTSHQFGVAEYDYFYATAVGLSGEIAKISGCEPEKVVQELGRIKQNVLSAKHLYWGI